MPKLSVSNALPRAANQEPVAIAAPEGSRRAHREMRHGLEVEDDYYWLRDRSDPEVTRYLEAENAYTAAATTNLQPLADELYGEMLGRIKQTDLSVPTRRGEYLYYSRTEEGEQYGIHCRRRETMEAPEEVLLDPNKVAAGRKFVSIGSFAVSDNNRLLAYTVDFAGFRQYSLQLKDLQTGQTLADTTERVTSVEWAADNQTLLLTTEDPVTKRSDTLLRHRVGGEHFETLYQESDELYDVWTERSKDKKFVQLVIASKDTTEVRFLQADRPDGELQTFLPREKGHRYYVDHREGLFYIRTNKGAKDFRVVTVPVGEERVSTLWTEFLAHRPGILVERIELYRNFAAVIEKSEALEKLRFYHFDTGEWSYSSFPEPVYSVSPVDTPDFESRTYRYRYQSFLTPPSIYDFDTESRTSVLLKRQEVPGGYDASKYVSDRLWATARDGVRVPISIVYPKGLKRDGQAPLLLYGYGSYGIGIPPDFSVARLSLLDRGMSYAIAHIRGGDELGEQWREDGMLMKKMNTFQDFIDCSEYLIKEGWTSPSGLAIEGGSAGGLLVGAVINMRPDLFRAAHLAVPFVDVINTMMDASLPLTVGEYLEWGNPNEKTAYDYMRSYDPYGNLKQQDYPAILVTTSLNDSQVMYWEPAKYIAKLRTVNTSTAPVLLKIKMEPAGHGGASGRYDRLKDIAFEYSWILAQVGIPPSSKRAERIQNADWPS